MYKEVPYNFHLVSGFKTFYISALAGVAQWIEYQPSDWKVTSSIPGQGIYLGCRPGPQLGLARGNQSIYFSHVDVSLSLFLPSILSKSKNK